VKDDEVDALIEVSNEMILRSLRRACTKKNCPT
jgi:hypothetical protein